MKVKDFVSSTNWCQKALCRDVNDNVLDWPFSRNVCKWCLTGMVLYCYIYENKVKEILNKIKERVGNTAHYWNDQPERTWEDIRNLAIELDI